MSTPIDHSFTVHIASSNLRVTVAPGVSIVEALAAAGVDVMTSCGQGVCGTCMTTVLAGVPEHRDNYLTAEERAANDVMMPCCSRARSSSLTLDL